MNNKPDSPAPGYDEWFLAAVGEGVRAADQGVFATDEEVRAVFAAWGVDIDEPLPPT